MLEEIFRPKGIAVIGASENKEKIGYQIFTNIIKAGYEGEVYPVNPKLEGKKLEGRKGFASVKDIPISPELAIIVIPSEFVLKALIECGEKGVKGVIVISAGFKEKGEEGVALEKKLIEVCRKYGMRMIGPNVLGIIDTYSKLNASFAPLYPPQGNFAFFSQSGALGCAVLDRIAGEYIGLSKFISLGNKADISEIEILKMLEEDETSKVILGYLESLEDGRKFMEVAKGISKKKPIILLKSGREKWGSKAVLSHTGALAGEDEAFDVAFKQSGIIRANTFEEAFSLVKGFLKQRIPTGKKILVVTNAGGAGVLATDMIERGDLEMAEIGKKIKDKLKRALPSYASVENPVDVVGDAREDRYREVLRIVGDSKNVDAFLILLTPQSITQPLEIAKAIVEETKNREKTVFTSFMGYEKVKEAVKLLEENGIPNYPSPAEAVFVLKAMTSYREWKEKKKEKFKTFEVDKRGVFKTIEKFKREGYKSIGGSSALEIFHSYGIPVVENFLIKKEEELKKILSRLSPPYVMKIESRDILHKSEVGGVKLNLSREELFPAFREMISKARKTSSNILGISLQPMVEDGKELLIGVSKDPVFGHMARFGLGGKYVEVFRDSSSRIIPLGENEAYEMIKETKFAWPLLKGVRGERSSDIALVVEVILRLSQMVLDFPEIIEIEANPFMVFEKGGVVVDARLRIVKNS